MQFLNYLFSYLSNIRLHGINRCLVLSILYVGHITQPFFSTRTNKQTQMQAGPLYDTVRVLLKTVPYIDQHTDQHADQHVVLISTTGECLQVCDTNGKKVIKAPTIDIQVKKGILYVNGKKNKQSRLHIASLSGHICIDGKSYDGYLS